MNSRYFEIMLYRVLVRFQNTIAKYIEDIEFFAFLIFDSSYQTLVYISPWFNSVLFSIVLIPIETINLAHVTAHPQYEQMMLPGTIIIIEVIYIVQI